MQKREMYRKGMGRASMIAALCLALWNGPGRAGDSWERGMGGVLLPLRNHPAASGNHGRYQFVSASAANPFSIPGLYVSTVFLSVVRTGWSTGISWERTGISGYSRDLYEAAAGLALPGRLLNFGLKVLADSRSVSGIGRETGVSAACCLSLEIPSIAVIELESAVVSGEGAAHATLCAGSGGTFLLLTIGRRNSGGRIIRAGASIRLVMNVSFLAGYDIETGEVSGGISLLAPARMAVSWSVHPLLGATFSVSVGALR